MNYSLHHVSYKCSFHNEIIWSLKSIYILVMVFFHTNTRIYLSQYVYMGHVTNFFLFKCPLKRSIAQVHMISSVKLDVSSCLLGDSYWSYITLTVWLLKKKTSIKSSEKTCCGIWQYLLLMYQKMHDNINTIMITI